MLSRSILQLQILHCHTAFCNCTFEALQNLFSRWAGKLYHISRLCSVVESGLYLQWTKDWPYGGGGGIMVSPDTSLGGARSKWQTILDGCANLYAMFEWWEPITNHTVGTLSAVMVTLCWTKPAFVGWEVIAQNHPGTGVWPTNWV